MKPYISGISITEGEPLLHPGLVDSAVSSVRDIMGSDIHLELVTNETNLMHIPRLSSFANFSAIHISRHTVDDCKNRRLMGFPAPSFAQTRELVSQTQDPGKFVLNCVMQKRRGNKGRSSSLSGGGRLGGHRQCQLYWIVSGK